MQRNGRGHRKDLSRCAESERHRKHCFSWQIPMTADAFTVTRSLAALLVAAAIVACESGIGDANRSVDVNWSHFGGDPGGTRYSSLADIDRTNVQHLRIAWAVRTGEFDKTLSMRTRFETTPVSEEGVIYVPTPQGRVLALDASTGARIWMFDSKVDIGKNYVEGLTSRGVALWSAVSRGGHCSKRVYLTTVDGRLIALDARHGLPCMDFGSLGTVDLLASLVPGAPRTDAQLVSFTSPPAIVRDVVIVGSAINGNVGPRMPPGIVLAYDARTGVLRWSHTVLRSEAAGEPDRPPFGGGNVWSLISTDPARGTAYLPTAGAAPSAFGGFRPGPNADASSVIAVDAATGKVLWSFQTVYHDLWDYDVAAQPMLVTVDTPMGPIDAVIVGSKTGMMFVLDRNSGKPLHAVQQPQVPPSDVDDEISSPIQPLTLPGLRLHSQRLSVDSLFGVSAKDRSDCSEWMQELRNEGLFTPPSLRGSLIWPGIWGGINWDGMAWDVERGLVITTLKRLAFVVQLHRRTEPLSGVVTPGAQRFPQWGTPYSVTRAPFVSASGIPCSPPPWGELLAVDLRTKQVHWRKPLGRVPQLSTLPGSENWGSLIFGGPLVTAGGLVFVAAGQDNKIRAFDIETGEIRWEHTLPAGGTASPMTYRRNGRQYVVIAAGGRAGIGSAGDWIVAFALN